MKGIALILLCAVALAQAEPQRTVSGKICNCNPAEAPTVCSQNGSDDELIVHENCNQFYKCFDGNAVPYYCPPGLVYNFLEEICDWRDNVECGSRPIVEEGEEVECSQENGNNDQTDNGNNGNVNDNPEDAPAICAAEGSYGVLISHENCNMFYKCDHGKPVAFKCYSGLHYNPQTEKCDWPLNVECGDRLDVDPEDNNNGGEDESDDSEETNTGNGDNGGNGDGGNGDGGNGGTCNCSPGEAPGICAADGSDNTLVAHENCNQFYKCAHGIPVTMNCPPGLLYNPHIENCDWPNNVECGDKPIVEIDNGGSDNGNGDNGNGDSGNGDNSGTCNCNPDEAPGICAAAGSNGILVAHENCNQFYKCDHGAPVTFTCPAGLVYNPFTECCDWPENVECGKKPIVEVDGGNNGNGDSGSGDNGSSGENGNGDNGSGNGNGDNGGTCNCNPDEAPAICAADGSDNTLVAHENCNQFYKCAHGIPVTMNCPPGLLYNPHIENCDWPNNVECGDKPIVEIDNGGSDNGNGDNGNGDSGNGDNSGTCNCNPDEAPGICAAAGSNGILVAHENCNQFYKCDHGAPVTFTCPAGLVYNPFTECCDWPENVECGKKPIVEVDGGNNGNGDSGSGDNGSSGENGNGDNGGEDSGNGNGNGDNGGSGTCNCNPDEAPSICAAEGSGGILIAHENCNQFYKCDHGFPVAFFCSNGLKYNPYTEQCDWPQNVDCNGRPIVEVDGGNNGNGDNGGEDSGNGNGDNGGSGTCNCNPGEAPGICAAEGSGGILIAHENCNQFYKCDHGFPVAFFCSNGLKYNPYTEQCDWPQNVDCNGRPIVEVDGGNTGNGDNGGEDSGNGNGDNGGSGTCNCNPGEAPGICAAEGSGGILIAHENCNQFYKCDHGFPVAFFCSNGLKYNPYSEQCDWPQNVDCNGRPIVEVDGGNNGNGDNGGEDSGNGNGDNGGSGTCNCNPGEAPGICAAEGSGGILIAHENCNQFYKCDHGFPVAFFCSNGLKYNPYTEQCDWSQNVDCNGRPIVEVDGGNTGNGDNGGEDSGNGNGDNGGSGTCNCNPGEAPGICAAEGSGGILIAHENCNQFYKCDHGFPVAFFCSNGLKYNPYSEQCDWPQNVDCNGRPIVEVDGGNNGNGDNGGEDSGNGNGDNGGSGTCNCNPGEAPGICAAEGSGGILIAHENCNQFYKCDHGFPVAFFCSNGLKYNPYTEQCDWPQNVDCNGRPIVEVDGGNTGNGDNGDGDDGSNGGNGNGDNGGEDSGNGNGDNGGSGTCNCNPGEAPGICAAEGSGGILIAHENCNQFYKCDHGFPVAFFCSNGLKYNPYTEQCDWPQYVDCNGRPIVEVDGGNNGNGDNGDGDDSSSGGNGNGDNGGEDSGNGNGNGNNGGSGTCNCNPGEAPGICAAKGSGGILIAHENCDQFYKCDQGVPVAFSCNIGLLYNPYTEQCDWPKNVNCGDRPTVEIEGGNNGNGDNGGGDDGNSGGNGDNGNGAESGSSNEIGNCDPSEAPALCAASGSDGVLVAHENCNQFYKCSEGIPVALICPSNLLYKPATEQCDWPENVDCGDRVIPEDNGGDNGGDGDTGDNGTGDNNGGSDTCNCNPEEAPAICATGDSEGILIAHEKCNQFYKCSFGNPVALVCPNNLLYNPYSQVCDWPQNVDCGDRIIIEGDNNGDSDNNEEDNSGGDNGGDNSNTGPYTDPSEAPSICASSGSNGVLVAHEICDQFYVCSAGLPVVLSCPSNLLYNPTTGQCDWPRNVDCGDRIVTEHQVEEVGTCSCNSREAPSICAGSDSNGKMIAHESCNQYYVCFNGIPIARSCPASLFYEPHTKQCNWPAAVNCDGRDVASHFSLNKHMQARRGIF